ncbi:hypothetical protein PMIN06_002492 [Paraphaeosphaeria minitans]
MEKRYPKFRESIAAASFSDQVAPDPHAPPTPCLPSSLARSIPNSMAASSLPTYRGKEVAGQRAAVISSCEASDRLHTHSPSIFVPLRAHSSVSLTRNEARACTMRSIAILASVGAASASAIIPQAIPIRNLLRSMMRLTHRWNVNRYS